MYHFDPVFGVTVTIGDHSEGPPAAMIDLEGQEADRLLLIAAAVAL
jgi:hypothetical protein